ncbi:hypothetical protein Tco_0819455, partial [Tanacetum coccineum]
SDDDDQQVNVAPKNNGDKENIDSSDVDRVSESSFFHVNDLVFENPSNINAGDNASKSADSFNIYPLLNELNNTVNNPNKSGMDASIGPEYPRVHTLL